MLENFLLFFSEIFWPNAQIFRIFFLRIFFTCRIANISAPYFTGANQMESSFKKKKTFMPPCVWLLSKKIICPCRKFTHSSMPSLKDPTASIAYSLLNIEARVGFMAPPPPPLFVGLWLNMRGSWWWLRHHHRDHLALWLLNGTRPLPLLYRIECVCVCVYCIMGP